MRRIALAAITLLFSAQLGFGVTIGQIDNFETGLSNWFAGGGPFMQLPPVPPEVVPDGGPDGAGDAYMKVTSLGGGGAGSRLAVMNGTQWAGNYMAAGLSQIQMDFRNLGATDLTLRLLFEDPVMGPPMNEAVTTFGFNLAAGGGWQRAVFLIDPSALTALSGNATAALANTTILRIIHNPLATFPPPPIAAVLGIDNISITSITAVPEPSVMWMVAIGAGALLLSRRARGPGTKP